MIPRPFSLWAKDFLGFFQVSPRLKFPNGKMPGVPAKNSTFIGFLESFPKFHPKFPKLNPNINKFHRKRFGPLREKMGTVKKQPKTAAIKTRSTKRNRTMKIEQKAGHISGAGNGHIQPSTGGPTRRFDLPSPETIAAHTVPPPAMPEPLFYDIDQAAAALNVCTKTVRRLIARGKLTSCKHLRKILIPRNQIEGFIKASCPKPDFQI